MTHLELPNGVRPIYAISRAESTHSTEGSEFEKLLFGVAPENSFPARGSSTQTSSMTPICLER
jgi:hypothetical protein